MRRRNALIVLCLLLPLPSLGVWLGLIAFPGTGLGKACYLGAKGAVLLLPLAWHLLVDGGRPSWSPARQGGLLFGAFLGLVTAGVIFLAEAVLGGHLDPTALRDYAVRQGLDRTTYLGLAAFLCLVNAPLEEYVWRWFVVRQGERLLPRTGAIVLSALGFTAHHLLAMGLYLPGGLVLVAGGGIALGAALWSWLYLRHGSIWPAWLAHLGADVAILAIGYRIIFGTVG